MSVHPLHPWIPEAQEAVARVGGLVGTVDLRDRLGLSRQRISEVVRSPDFPKPFTYADGRPLWLGQEIDYWWCMSRS